MLPSDAKHRSVTGETTRVLSALWAVNTLTEGMDRSVAWCQGLTNLLSKTQSPFFIHRFISSTQVSKTSRGDKSKDSLLTLKTKILTLVCLFIHNMVYCSLTHHDAQTAVCESHRLLHYIQPGHNLVDGRRVLFHTSKYI